MTQSLSPFGCTICRKRESSTNNPWHKSSVFDVQLVPEAVKRVWVGVSNCQQNNLYGRLGRKEAQCQIIIAAQHKITPLFHTHMGRISPSPLVIVRRPLRCPQYVYLLTAKVNVSRDSLCLHPSTRVARGNKSSSICLRKLRRGTLRKTKSQKCRKRECLEVCWCCAV